MDLNNILDVAEEKIGGYADMDTLMDTINLLSGVYHQMDGKQQERADAVIEDAWFWTEATSAKISWDGIFSLTGMEAVFNSVYRTDQETVETVLSVAQTLEQAGCGGLADDLFSSQGKDVLELIEDGDITLEDEWQYPASLKLRDHYYLAFSYGPDHDSLVDAQEEIDRNYR